MQYNLLSKAQNELKTIKKQLKMYNDYIDYIIYDRTGENVILQAKLPVFENNKKYFKRRFLLWEIFILKKSKGLCRDF